MEIRGDRHDIKSMIMFAFRYAMGRKTFASNIITEIIVENLEIFSRNEIAQMITEIDFQERLGGLGDDCDILTWKDFKQLLLEIITVKEVN